MVKKLGIPIFFELSCADLRSEEQPCIISKLINLGLSDEELKNLSYQERRNNNNPILKIIKLKYFSRKSYLIPHWENTY